MTIQHKKSKQHLLKRKQKKTNKRNKKKQQHQNNKLTKNKQKNNCLGRFQAFKVLQLQANKIISCFNSPKKLKKQISGPCWGHLPQYSRMRFFKKATLHHFIS